MTNNDHWDEFINQLFSQDIIHHVSPETKNGGEISESVQMDYNSARDIMSDEKYINLTPLLITHPEIIHILGRVAEAQLAVLEGAELGMSALDVLKWVFSILDTGVHQLGGQGISPNRFDEMFSKGGD